MTLEDREPHKNSAIRTDIDSCKRRTISPNYAIMMKFFKRTPKKAEHASQAISAALSEWDGAAYIIGDIHGCYDQLEQLIANCRAHSHERGLDPDKTELISLGDLVDRGPDSAKVMERLVTFDEPWARLTCLMGNHEEIMLKVLDGDVKALTSWFRFGGKDTCYSYGVENLGDVHLNPEHVINALKAAIPNRHIDFLKGLPDSHTVGPYLCVHAGIRPGVPLEEQSSRDLRWIREDFLDSDQPHPAIIIHGHTVVERIETHANRIAVDTGANLGGPLSAIFVQGTERMALMAFPDTA